jgi:uncharacterized repeat protein (TIGR03803 family)
LQRRGCTRRRRVARVPSLEVLEPLTLLSGAPASLTPRVATERAAPAYAVLHNFGSGVATDGIQPWGSLAVAGSARAATLVGATRYGGAHGAGTLFMLKPGGSGYRVVHAFAGGPNDGAQPMNDQLRQQGQALYGTTLRGGPANQGVIFRLKTSGAGYRLIHPFLGGPNDGAQPYSSPLPVGKVLYGMTARGGAYNQGTLYSLSANGAGFHIIHAFSTSSGSQPHGFVVKVGNALYGMTRLGGVKADGVIFRYDLRTGTYSILHQFTGGPGDGAVPYQGGLTLVGKQLYGLTTEGASRIGAFCSGSTRRASTSRSCMHSPAAPSMAGGLGGR